MNNAAILKVENLKKSFGGVIAVNDVSFELRQGEFLGIIGPNGSGKTTLINLITGYVRPDSGTITYQGKNITGAMPYKTVNLGISRTFQMSKPFYRLAAFKNLIPALYSSRVRKARGGKYGERDDMALDFLDEMGFERDSFVPYKLAGSLPHGYLKRLDLARAVCLRPDLLILDELFSGMAMSEVASTLPIIERYSEKGLTIIMIEHRLSELCRMAKRLIALNFGTKIADGSPQEVINNEEVKKAYLGTEEEVG